MRARLFIPVLLTLLALVASSASAQDAPPLHFEQLHRIVIDPGHGGEDSGCVGHLGIAEKILTLAVALQLRDALAERAPDLDVVMTRDDDTYPTLEERTHLANVIGADLFVSLHFNSAENIDAHGIETFFIAADGTAPGEIVPGREDDGPAELYQEVGVVGDLGELIVQDLMWDGAMRESARLAEVVQDAMLAATGANDRDVRQGRFRVLQGADMPAIVVELGFLTNIDEGKLVTDPQYQAVLVDGLIDALRAYDDWSETVSAELISPTDPTVEVAGIE